MDLNILLSGWFFARCVFYKVFWFIIFRSRAMFSDAIRTTHSFLDQYSSCVDLWQIRRLLYDSRPGLVVSNLVAISHGLTTQDPLRIIRALAV